MKKYIICILLSIPTCILNAQDDNPYQEYQNFVKQELKRIDDYRKKENANFLGFLKEYWEYLPSQKAVPNPVRPEPVKPIVRELDIPLTSVDEIIVSEVIAPPAITPSLPKQETSPAERSGFKFMFYGTPCHMNPTKTMQLPIGANNATIESLQTAWNKLNNTNIQTIIDDCLLLKQKMRLNDWGYVLLTKQLSTLLTGNNKNAATFLQFFLLSQSGYNAKVGRVDGTIVLLLASKTTVYAVPFMNISGTQYYIYADGIGLNPGQVETFKQSLSYATYPADYSIRQQLILEQDNISKQLKTKNASTEVTAVINKNLINYYKDYPQCELDIYARSPISESIQQSVLPALKAQLQGKSETEAANTLLHFVQTAFGYKTDAQHFGYEKTFFVEETFFYPYSDCEDRAILYAWLVKNIIGIEVLLLNYPGHVATAVKFREEVKGDFIRYKNQRYIICDPTYINANIGEAMPSSKQQTVKIILLK